MKEFILHSHLLRGRGGAEGEGRRQKGGRQGGGQGRGRGDWRRGRSAAGSHAQIMRFQQRNRMEKYGLRWQDRPKEQEKLKEHKGLKRAGGF